MVPSIPDDATGRKPIRAGQPGSGCRFGPAVTGLNDHGYPLAGRRTAPTVIFPRPGTGRTPSESRESRPQLRITGRQPWTSMPVHKRQWLTQHGFTRETYDAGITSSPYTPRFDPAGFIPGDGIGLLTVTENLSVSVRWHDFPCQCTFGIPGCGVIVTEPRYLCRCDCGTERAYSGGRLATGQSLSCGHAASVTPVDHPEKSEHVA